MMYHLSPLLTTVVVSCIHVMMMMFHDNDDVVIGCDIINSIPIAPPLPPLLLFLLLSF
jgi:hypothetical protein